MLNKIKALKLNAVSPSITSINYDRSLMAEGESEIEISFTHELLKPEGKDKELQVRKLKYSVLSESKGGQSTPFFKLHISVEYFFDIIDSDTVSSMTDEEVTDILISYCFLDIRRRFYNSINLLGITGIKLPLNLQDMYEK